MAYKSLEIKGLSQRMWCTNRLYGIRTPTFMAYAPPLLCHMNRFYWGWGVVFNLLIFWPQRKTFQAGGGYKNPIKIRKAISTTEIFPPWTPFFFGKEKFCTGAGRCMPFFFFPVRYVKTLFSEQLDAKISAQILGAFFF